MITKPFDIPCVILSGGRSSRMQEDKSLLPFGNYNTLIEYQYKRLKPYFKNIYISSKTDKFDFLKEGEKQSQVEIILDDSKIYSPLVALKNILETLNEKKVFIIPVDTPFVKIETIKTLVNEMDNFDIVIAKTIKTHNLCGVYDKQNLFSIYEMLKNDNHKISLLLENNKTKIVSFPNNKEFINLNNKDDYYEALTLISKFYN